ncbi:hypothetical protein HN51_047758 [Arachis hypogaea]
MKIQREEEEIEVLLPLRFLSPRKTSRYGTLRNFYNWNCVKLRYCDGASFIGDAIFDNRVQHVTQCSKTECINFKVQIPLHFEALISHPDTNHNKLKIGTSEEVPFQKLKMVEKRLSITLTITFAAISFSTAISAVHVLLAYVLSKKCKGLKSKILELEASLKSSLDKCASEKTLRKVLSQPKYENLKLTYYPMASIGTICSCFSTRNWTPRQPLLVPLARACLVFYATRVLLASLEGQAEYSHCWVLYIFHLNTDLEKLWKHPSQSGFKAKVGVLRLKGGRMGVFATRSPYRPCPIGLTVAKANRRLNSKAFSFYTSFSASHSKVIL